jgi:hypothetical protein
METCSTCPTDALGPRSIWAQRLAPETHKPLGEPWIVYTPASPSESIASGHRVGAGFAASHLFLGVQDSRSNIWLAE